MERISQREGDVMNPVGIKEIREIFKPESNIGNITKAFEKIKAEISPVEHISTINEKWEGCTYKDTNVRFERKTFMLGGIKVEGVFPVFESKCDIMLPKDLWKASDTEQFKYCTEKLAKKIEENPELAKQFTPRQLEQIKNGEPRISGLTWHHNEEEGKMQLVDAKEHSVCRHTGGRSLWGGGSDNR